MHVEQQVLSPRVRAGVCCHSIPFSATATICDLRKSLLIFAAFIIWGRKREERRIIPAFDW
jgi:hypothetical protein